VLTGRAADALSWLKGLTSTPPAKAARLVAMSKLLAANGLTADAIETATQASRSFATDPAPLEQLASLFADAGDVAQLDQTVSHLRALAPDRAGSLYYAAVSAFLHGQVDETVRLAERAIAADPRFAPVYDLVGAAYTKLERPLDAKKAFEASLRFDAHDSTAYTNLGLLELAGRNRPAAANYFAEALGLAPNSRTAREGLAQAQSR
jgi:Flp pilus assembly protein TadD